MTATIKANVTAMFSILQPWDCSNSEANYGPNAAKMTWENAQMVARAHESWLECDLVDACESLRTWAAEIGAWDSAEISGWSDVECLGLFVQSVASELRLLGSDSESFEACVRKYAELDHDNCDVCGNYFHEGDVKVDYYTGI